MAGVLIRRGDTDSYRRKATRGHGKKTAAFKPRAEASGDTSPAHTWAPPSSLQRREKHRLCLRASGHQPPACLRPPSAPLCPPPWWLQPRWDRPGPVLPGFSLGFFRGRSGRNPPRQGGGRLFWEVSVTLPPTKLFSLSLGSPGPAPRTAPRRTPAQEAAASALGPPPSSSCTLCAGAWLPAHPVLSPCPPPRVPLPSAPASQAHGSALLALRHGPWGESGSGRQAGCWHLCPGGGSGRGSPAGPGLTRRSWQ